MQNKLKTILGTTSLKEEGLLKRTSEKTALMQKVEAKMNQSIRSLLKYYYEKRKFSWSRIAEITSVSKRTLRHWARSFGIESRTKSEATKLQRSARDTTEYSHLAVCLCSACRTLDECGFEKSHEDGRCIMRCVSFVRR